MTDDDLLRDLYRAGCAAEARGPSDCPVTPERMLALLEGRLGRRERLATMGQILHHPACRAEFAMLHAVWQAAEGRAQRRRWSAVALRAAAAIVALIGAGTAVATLWRSGREEPMRGPEAAVELITPTGALAGPVVLTWHRTPGADRYEAVVADSGGMPMMTRTTPDTTLAAGTLPPGRYRWWVRATRSDGTIVRSPIQPFSVAR
jgi:hypothetical protein